MTITETENKDDKFLKFLLENKRPSPWSFCEESRTTGDPRWTFGSRIMGTYLMDNKDFKKLNTLRLTYLADREELLMYRKEIGKPLNDFDKDVLRVISEQEKKLLRLYRAICLVIGYNSPDALGDCPYIDIYYWNEGLHQECWEIYSYVIWSE